MLTINFHHNRKGKLNKDGRGVISMRLYENERNVYISTGIFVTPQEWDNKRQKVKVNRFALEYNKELSAWRDKAFKAYFDIKKDGDPDLSLVLLRLKNKDIGGNFITFVKDRIKKNKGIENSTKGQHNLLVKYLSQYNQALPFSKITYQYLVNFQLYLMQLTSERHKPLHTNYIALLFRIFRGYVTEAIKEGYMNKDPFLSFKIKKEATNTIYLTPDELAAFESVMVIGKYPNEQIVKDVFLFSCFTGLRISDALGAKANHIIKTNEGLRLIKKPKKTKKKHMIVDLPLYLLFEGKPQKIITPYLEDKKPDDNVFPGMTDKTYNDWIRKLRTRAGINKHFTSHTARHTFGMFMVQLYPISAVSKMMGHASVATTEVYARMKTSTIDEMLR